MCFERALAADPHYALPYAGLSDAYLTLGTTLAMPPGDAFPRAKLFAQEGLALDDTSGELHCSLGQALRFHDWDWPGAEREYLRALELDPLSLIIYTVVGDTLFYARRYEESITYYARCHEMDPSLGPGNTDLACSLEHVGRYDEALERFRRGTASADGAVPPSTGLAIMLWRTGQHDDARRVIAEVQERAAFHWIAPFGIASFHAVAGEIGGALDWLERGYEKHDSSMVYLKVHPRLDVLRGEPRFRDLLTRMHLDA